MLPKLKNILLVSILCGFGFIASKSFAQDTAWQQVLSGWVDDVYYENLFLGGSFYTKISLADIDNDGDLDMFYGGGDCGTLVYFENTGTAQVPIFTLRYDESTGRRSPRTRPCNIHNAPDCFACLQ